MRVCEVYYNGKFLFPVKSTRPVGYLRDWVRDMYPWDGQIWIEEGDVDN
jgi:hypothetical protein